MNAARFRDTIRDWIASSPLSALVLFFAVTFPLWSNAYLTAPDSASYYAVTRSLVRGLDLDFSNDYEALRFRTQYLYLTSEDRLANDWPIGTGLLWIPPFLVAEAVAHVCAMAGIEGHQFTEEDPYRHRLLPRPLTAGWDEPAFAPTGQSGIYRLLVSLFIVLYVILGLRIAIAMAEPIGGRLAALAAAFAVLLGTPVGYYTFSFGMMSHAASMTAVGVLLWLWHRTRHERTLAHWLLLGALAGLVGMIRPQDLAFLAVFPVELLLTPRRTRGEWGPYIRGAFAAAGAAILVFSPQLILWHTLYGNPVQFPKVEEMQWLSPNIVGVLFSDYHGLLSWSPVLILTVPGLVILALRDRVLAAAFAVIILLQVYLNAANEFWWASGSFGNRRFVNLGVPFVVCLAVFFGAMRPLLSAVLAVPAALWNMTLWARERGGELVLERYIPFDADFFRASLEMLNPVRMFTGLLGDFSGFGWTARVITLVLGVAAAFLAARGARRSWHPRWRSIAGAVFLLYVFALPPLTALAALRTGRLGPAEYPMLTRENRALFINYYEAGYYHLEKENFDRAEDYFQRAARLDPSDAIAWRYLGAIALVHRERPEEAIVYTGRALDLRPDYEQALELELQGLAILFDASPGRFDLLERAIERLEAAGDPVRAEQWREFLAQRRAAAPQ